MKPILLIAFLGYLVLCPFYIFNNGYPQVADYILAIGFAFFLWKTELKFFFKQPIKTAGVLVIIIAVVGAGNQLDLYKNELEGNTLFPILFYIFNFLAFGFVLFLSNTFGRQKLYNFTSIVLVIAIVSQFSLAVFDIQNTTNIWVQRGSRDVLFFNNPNQLGYFSLLVLSLFITIPSTIKKNKIVLMSVAIMTFYIALVSQSRIAVIGTLYLISFIVFTEFRPYTKKSILTMVFILSASLIILNTPFIKDKLSTIQIRSDKRSTTISNEVSTRGFDRIYKHPFYLIIGAGEGADQRFSTTNKELHSGFGTMLFSYGLIGLLIFCYFLYLIIQANIVYYSLLLLPIILYNLVHQGLRNTLFWIFLGFLVVNNREAELELIVKK